MKKEYEYQYLNTHDFVFDSEWKYGGKTYSDIRTRILELLAKYDGGEVLYYEVINPYGSLLRSKNHANPYVQQIYHSQLNLFLHYSLGQLAVAIEKKLAVPESELGGLSPKERSKKLKENERLIIETYAKEVKEFN